MKMMMLAIMRLVTWSTITINKYDETMNEVKLSNQETWASECSKILDKF